MDVATLPRYAAVIRAYQSTPLLAEMIAALRGQTAPPAKIIIVDSSGDPAVSAAFAALDAVVVQYPAGEFNYSRAINVGVAANDLPLTLIISSHVVVRAPRLIEKSWAAAGARGAEIVYWAYPYPEDTAPDELLIDMDRRAFDGRNGMSNAITLVPTHLLKARPFREEVFSAEDQEWTRYYLRTHRRPMLRIETKDIDYRNPNHSGATWSQTKVLNEELAIGHFVNRRLLMPDRILARVLRGALAMLRGRRDRAQLHFGFARALLMANFRQPKASSLYFDRPAAPKGGSALSDGNA